MEGEVANDDADGILSGAPGWAGGDDGAPSKGDDGRDGCLSAERSIVTGMCVCCMRE
jgi:hypothetical protein